MTKDRIRRRSNVGYGSTYTRGEQPEGIRTVLGGQVWMVKPDKSAQVVHPCIWMQAGVASFKNCNNYFDCTTCKYDQAMKRASENGKHPTWQEAMRRLPEMHRACRHSMTGRINARSCAYDYNCNKCDFDQYFEDVWSARAATMPSDVHTIKGFELPTDCYFHNGHTWARIESGGYIRIGLDDFALKLLGEADALDMPLMGKELDPGRPGWGFRRRSNEAEVLSPVGGVICEVNNSVRENPAIANDNPYSGGWLFLVRTGDIKKSVKELLAEDGAISWLNGEVSTLENMIEDVAGPLAADGGLLRPDIYGNLPDLGWNNLTRTFLKS